ncbi:dihydroorotase [Stomatohabitans albus]|uniref:dihydroorotase n=1 Tax=Stomatohabitans albus TaxID=3110766 RepID=UPI00300D83A8
MSVTNELLLTGLTLLDHTKQVFGHVHIVGDRIGAIYADGDDLPNVNRTIDLTGLTVTPGLVDIQVHFREPGGEGSETIRSGTDAAVAGGMTAVVTMPNTNPAVDSVEVVRDIQSIAAKEAHRLDIVMSGCLTVGRQGAKNVDYAALYEAGVRLFTDDGDAVMDAALMRNALQASTQLPGMVVAQHCEDANLVAGGVLTEGPVADQLGVAGRPGVAETIIVARDIELARDTRGRYHVLHLSTGASLALVRQAKADGLAVSCEVTPQHLVLTAYDVPRLGTSGRMNPPLRTASDVQALREGLKAQVIDAIATDHAPHAPALKAKPLDQAPPGMLGVETSWQVAWTHLVLPGIISPCQLVWAMSTRPAMIAGLHRHGQPIVPGSVANLTVIDLAATQMISNESIRSQSRNSPWLGDVFYSKVEMTLKDGAMVNDN